MEPRGTKRTREEFDEAETTHLDTDRWRIFYSVCILLTTLVAVTRHCRALTRVRCLWTQRGQSITTRLLKDSAKVVRY